MSDQNPTVERALQLLEVEALNFAYRFVKDSNARQWYIQRTQNYVKEVRTSYATGQMTARQAAEAAHQMRNEVMEMARLRSSDIGAATARQLKAKGLAFDDLVAKYSEGKFGKPYNKLSASQQEQVMLEIVDAAGRANPKVSLRARRLGAAGRGLWAFTIAVACYNIFTAEDKTEAAIREGVSAGGGFAGGAAGGALAGIWFGPLGIAVGVAIGGVVGALTADEVYVEVAGIESATVKAIIDPYTMPFHTDEAGLSKAIRTQCGIDMDKVHGVFLTLYRNYGSDSDDVAVLYLKQLKAEGGSPLHALRLHQPLKNLLIQILDEGWTSGGEAGLMAWLKTL